jgi:hypothetical protein
MKNKDGIEVFDEVCYSCDERPALLQISLSGPDGTVYDTVRLCADCAGLNDQSGGIVIDNQQRRLVTGVYDYRLNTRKMGV